MSGYTGGLAWAGTRAEVIEALQDLAEGWIYMGSPARAAQAQEGVDRISAGAAYAIVGRTRYQVEGER